MTGLLAGTLSNIRLAISNGATTVATVGTHTAATGTAPNPTAGRTGVTLAGLTNDFRITTTDLVATPLPIELTSFDALLVENRVKLSWETESELNNDFFTLERASDIEKFEKVTTVKGQGTLNSKTDYSFMDENPLLGVSYYRLKQTDFDGKFTYSTLRKIEITEIETHFKIYPNPAVDRKFTFEMTGINSQKEVPLKIINLQGVAVYEASFKADESGRISTTIQLDNAASGVYLVIVNAATGLRKKIVIP